MFWKCFRVFQAVEKYADAKTASARFSLSEFQRPERDDTLGDHHCFELDTDDTTR